MKMTLAEIAKAINAQNDISAWKDVVVTSVAFDSRHEQENSLFIPLQGNRDGHEFVPKAFENGAGASLWAKDHPITITNHPLLVVDDPLDALQKLSKYYLHKINPLVIGVTGSNGKTTTKDLIASILSTQMNVTKTHANFNNEIGVPVTLLNMEANTEAVVVEMGMDHFGQLDRLSRLTSPDIAVITMIGEAHIEFFHTRDRIADAKMEIVNGLKEDGTFVFNGDEPLLQERAKKVKQLKRTFGRQLINQLYATSVHSTSEHIEFTTNEWPDVTFELPMIGEYNVNNALAALTVGKLLHVTPQNMQRGLANVVLTANRAEWVDGKMGEKILSDVYNSNPTAVKKVLKTFAAVPTNGKRIIVLGDMLELGEASPKLHASVASSIDPNKINAVYLVGPEMKALQKQLLDNGYPKQQLHHYDTDQLDSLAEDLSGVVLPNDIVMIKGSHGIHLEKVLQKLAKQSD